MSVTHQSLKLIFECFFFSCLKSKLTKKRSQMTGISTEKRGQDLQTRHLKHYFWLCYSDQFLADQCFPNCSGAYSQARRYTSSSMRPRRILLARLDICYCYHHIATIRPCHHTTLSFPSTPSLTTITVSIITIIFTAQISYHPSFHFFGEGGGND